MRVKGRQMLRAALALALVFGICVPTAPSYAEGQSRAETSSFAAASAGLPTSEQGDSQAASHSSQVSDASSPDVAEPFRSAAGDLPHAGASPSSGSAAPSLMPQADVIDLNDSWKAQVGGVAVAYSITRPGIYRLTADLSADNGILVNAPGADVVIEFAGHTLETTGIGGSANAALVRIAAASSVTLDGSEPAGDSAATSPTATHETSAASPMASFESAFPETASTKTTSPKAATLPTSALDAAALAPAAGAQTSSALVSKGASAVWGVSSEAAGCTLKIADLSVRIWSKSPDLKALGDHCVRALDGTVELQRCTFDLDLGNQQMIAATAEAAETPSAVYLGEGVSEAVLEDCAASAVGTPSIALDDPSDLVGLGNAYALCSLGDAVTVSGGSYRAQSARGSAAGIFARKLEVARGPVELSASAGVVAAGLVADRAGAIALNAAVSFESADSSARYAAALRASAQGAFAFGYVPDGAARLSALVSPGAPAEANADGAVIGSLTGQAAASNAARTTWAAALSNALADGACRVACEADELVFALDAPRAVARIGQVRYATVEQALAAFSDGDTLTLLADAGALVVDAARAGVVDLGGHTVESFSFTTSGRASGEAGLVLRNGTVSGTRAHAQGPAAILYGSALPFAIESVNVRAHATDNSVAGVYATSSARGRLDISNSRICVTATRTSASMTAYGIRVDRSSSSELSVVGCELNVSSASGAVSLCGIQALSSCDVRASSVTVAGSSATTGAIQAAKTVSVSDSRLLVSTSAPATAAYGLWATSASPAAEDVLVDGCEVHVECASGAVERGYWCLRGATVATEQPVARWTLDGICSFRSSSASHIGLNVGQVVLGEAFGLAGGSDAVLRLSQRRCADDIGFTAASGTSIARHAATFAPLAGSAYEGWRLVPSGSQLAWAPAGAPAAGAVILTHGGVRTPFARVSDALASAGEGDVITLSCDLEESGALAVRRDDLTLDLAGHALTIRAAGQASASAGTSGALSYAGSAGGTLSITSSVGRATFALEAGADTEPANGATYQGIAIAGGGTVSIASAVTVRVSYAGGAQTSAQRAVALRGIAVSEGALALDGALEVRAAGFPGVLDATGVFAQAGQGASANVVQSSSSSVSVINETPLVVSDPTIYSGSSSLQSAQPALREIHPDPDADPAFYEALQQQFRISALYDNPDDYEPKTQFGTGIYYTSGFMKLTDPGAWYDGLAVMACSDVVPSDQVGRLAAIRATHFFVQTAYDTLPQARAFASSADSKGAVDVRIFGLAEASCPQGDVIALDAQGVETTSWQGRARGVAAHANEQAHFVTDGVYDLRDFVKFSKDYPERIAYNSGLSKRLPLTRYRSARELACSAAQAVAFDVSGVGAATDAPDGEAPFPEVMHTGFENGISVTFENAFDASGARLPDLSLTAAYGQTLEAALAQAKASLPAAASYADPAGNSTRRFVGWAVFTGGTESLSQVWDPDPAVIGRKLAFDYTVSGVTGGSVVLWATYVDVGPGQHLARFAVDHLISAYALDDGARPYYPDANPSATSYATPEKADVQTGRTYEFSGWQDASGRALPLVLPPATSDVAYRATFDGRDSIASVTFSYLRRDVNSADGYSRSTQVGYVDFSTSLQKVADGFIAEVGDPLAFGGRVYALRGWAVRDTDREPVFDADHPIPSGLEAPEYVAALSYRSAFYAIYDVADRTIDVSFYDGERLLATVNVLSATTLDAAFKSTGAQVEQSRSATEVFRGWGTDPAADSALDTTGTTVGSLADANGSTVSLYAVYGNPLNCDVRFYTLDGRRVLYEVRVVRGGTVAEVLAQRGVALGVPDVETGTYFAGWRTAAGVPFDLDSPVTGSASLYPRCEEVDVSTLDPADIDAVVTCTVGGLEDADEVVFRLRPTASADRPLRQQTADYGYSILKCYSMSLVAKGAGRAEAPVTGEFGVADVSVYVGAAYANAQVRLFWLNAQDRSSNSSVKEVDARGFVHASIGDYSLGDADEGGNLVVAYVEGGRAGVGGLGGAQLVNAAGVALAGGLSASLGGRAPSASAGAPDGGVLSAGPEKLAASRLSAEGSEDAAVGEQALAASEIQSGPSADVIVSALVSAAVLAFAVRLVWGHFAWRARLGDEDDADSATLVARTAREIRF